MQNNRTYLDYNATAPISSSVKLWLESGNFPFANPSSVHTSGKKVKRDIDKTKEFLFRTFGLSSDEYDLFFHSGATEGINTILRGHLNRAQKNILIYSKTDHSCVHNLALEYEQKDHSVYSFVTDLNDLEELIKTHQGDELVVNYTWVNNETGIVFPLEQIAQLKKKYQFKLHVDAVQSVGKIKDWNVLRSCVDACTFSGHKFGALKGIGFSFLKHDFKIFPLLRGGGQQQGHRSGTENTFGIYSLKPALEDILASFNYEKLLQAKNYFEEKLILALGPDGEVVGESFEYRNANTIYFILYETRAQISAMALDMAGMDVSNGSACSSGAVLPSRVLMAMGYSEEHAKSAIRLSFSPYTSSDDVIEIWKKFEKVLERFLS